MSDKQATIIYTHTDEAPALATYSLLPILRAFTGGSGIAVETRDISLAGRIIAAFPEYLTEAQRQTDDLAELGDLTQDPGANIVKLPNISASVPQIKAAITELQSQAYALPAYPDEPGTEEEREVRRRYDRVKGSAVNPVLREGNSDRRAPASVKQYVRSHPHSMGKWSADSRSHVDHMQDGDFFGSEKSVTFDRADELRVELTTGDGKVIVLKERISLLAGEVIDAAVMSCAGLRRFLETAMADAKSSDVLFSLHLKATMMKVSDPIIFGHAVTVFFKEVFAKHGDLFNELRVNPNNGLGDIYAHLPELPEDKRREIEADIKACYDSRPRLAMVDSDKGISNLHVPSDVIIDASMPAAIRSSGKMWGSDGQLHDTKAVIPDRCYAGVYQEVIEDCKQHGAFDPATLGSVPNVGLMAQKAEEYGSHDKTFEILADGKVRVVDSSGNVAMEHTVRKGDIWRMCQVKDGPVTDWIKLAVSRARATDVPAVFWLNEKRPHDAEIIKKVKTCLVDEDTSGLEILIMPPAEATRFSLERIRQGKDTISVTGNVLRDYLTDLFPIMELGTSAKMLSIVPLMKGGGLFETGAGGSAPKHVQQFVAENHLRWDSLGEFLALAASLEHLGDITGNEQARILAATLDQATGKFLDTNKSPSRKAGELDNRGSHFYLALYWAEALSKQTDSPELAERFAGLATLLTASEKRIVEELNSVQGRAVEMGGYYHPDHDKTENAMRPSATFNDAMANF
ncbi:MAG: NADP-dependent isocitrate dehydrogenase [Pseudohongiellaceae bacterium]